MSSTSHPPTIALVGTSPKTPAMSAPVSTATTPPPPHRAGLGAVDGADARMRMGAAEDSGVEHIRELDVVDKGPLAGQQLRVFQPFQRLACVGHARPPCCGETGVRRLRRGAMAEYRPGWRENLPVEFMGIHVRRDDLVSVMYS